MALHLNGFLRIVILAMVGVLFLSLAACQSDKDTLDVVQGGATDQPAPGFANIAPGSEQDFMLNVGRRIYFTRSSSTLDSVAQETLNLQAQWLNRYPNWLVKIQGFADDPGSGISNRTLSDKRARAVMDFLAARGVAAQRMWTKGYGKERLVASNCKNNSSCKAVNRRVIVNLKTSFDDSAPQYKGG